MVESLGAAMQVPYNRLFVVECLCVRVVKLRARCYQSSRSRQIVVVFWLKKIREATQHITITSQLTFVTVSKTFFEFFGMEKVLFCDDVRRCKNERYWGTTSIRRNLLSSRHHPFEESTFVE